MRNSDNRAWHLAVNVVGASGLVGSGRRMQILRRAGIDTRTPLIGPGCFFFGTDASFGSETLISHGCHFDNRARIEIGERVAVGYEAMFCTSGHEIGPARKRWSHWKAGPITVGDGSWIGTRAVVLGPVTIGPGCIVAAGAVVTRDCEPNGLYAGMPARRVRDLD